ncbi:hypothetical protein D3C84_1163050 [compost metagenome]
MSLVAAYLNIQLLEIVKFAIITSREDSIWAGNAPAPSLKITAMNSALKATLNTHKAA